MTKRRLLCLAFRERGPIRELGSQNMDRDALREREPGWESRLAAWADGIRARWDAGERPRGSVDSGLVVGSLDWLDDARRLCADERVGEALDVVYDNVDRLLTDGKFQDCDHLLRSIPVATESVDLILALLTVTWPARDLLAARAPFYKKVESALKDRGEYEDGLLSGLAE